MTTIQTDIKHQHSQSKSTVSTTDNATAETQTTDNGVVSITPFVPAGAWRARYAYVRIPVPRINGYRMDVKILDILKEWRCTQDLPNTPEFQSNRTILRLIKECDYIRILEMCIEHTSTGQIYVCFRVELIKHSEALDFIKSAVEAAGKEVQIVKN